MDTRDKILHQNYEAMKLYGFQGLRTDKVIGELGITKGAFYHYFPDKKTLGYAVVDELLAPHYIGTWQNLDQAGGNIIDQIVAVIRRVQGFATPENIHLGCPLNNLVQEMSPLDDVFRKKLRNVVDKQQRLIVDALEVAKQKGEVDQALPTGEVALFILAAVEGSFTMGKSFQDKNMFDRSINQLVGYVKSLKMG